MLPNVNLARQLDYKKKTHWMLNITAKVQVIIDTVDNAMTHETIKLDNGLARNTGTGICRTYNSFRVLRNSGQTMGRKCR